ncbi:pectin acetylesterase [Elysia marginata]|uniref:Pectin acetylesterase n=1 Tax=Elysia marginata TaxID=1093978 RepID=A0AAV4JX33_9GAST|nr:pectin acetylesterase [Elysia marginata]
MSSKGSSNMAKMSLSFDGIVSNDCQQNPDFCMWNVVAFLYCDGGSFLGKGGKDPVAKDTGFKTLSFSASAPIQECTQTKTAATQWRCLFPEEYYKFVFTPMFFANSIYDTWTRPNALKVSCSAKTCPDSNLATVYTNRDAVRALAREISGSSKKHAVFLTACPVHRMMIQPWLSLSVFGSPTMQVTLTAWLRHDETMSGSDVLLDITPAVEQCSSVLNR